MKKAKILSLFLAGTLLFHTAGIDALATTASAPVSDSESVEGTEEESSGDISDEESPEQPSTEDGDVEENPDQPSTEDSETKNPSEDEEKDTENEENSGNEEGSEDGENSENEENPDDQEAIEDEDPSTDEENSEDTVSENTISENALPEADENAFDIFPGLGDHYIMSSQQLADKRELAAHVGDIVEKNTGNAEDYPDAEGIYERGEVVYLAETEAEARKVAEAFGGTVDSYSYEVAVISLPEEATVAMAIAAAAEPDLKLPAVWPNYYHYLDSDTEVTPDDNTSDGYALDDNTSDDYIPDASTPSDPGFANQWQHDYIGTRYAWTAGFKGKGIKVAVIDTGLQRNHEDLSKNAVSGRNFSNGASGTAFDGDNGTHGTHVAGIIAAAENGKGGVGIAPEAQIRGYAVFNSSETTTTSYITRAINAAVSDGNDIINMSLGGPMYDGNYATIVQNAYKKGVAIFASAGNDDADANNFPAAYSGAISVGAVDRNSARASFSNYGSTVKLSFPGVGIYSTVPTGYGTMSGTSQASPAAAGTAAVILSARQDIRNKSGKARVDALLSVMKSSTTKCISSGMGAGTTWLPGVLKIATDMTAPDAPTITIAEKASDKAGKTYIAENVTVTLSTKTAVGVEIYYTTDGKTPAYKNGQITVGEKYSKAFPVGGARNKTIKAIAVNPITGKVSKVASKACVLTPTPASVTVVSADGVNRIAAGKSLKLTATVTPSYAISTKVVWTVDDTAKAQGITVSNGTVKTKASKTAPTKAGKYTVTATATEKDGKTTINKVKGTYTFTVIDSTAIKKVAFLDKETKKAPKSPNLDTVKNKTFDLKPFLSVTKTDATAKKDTELTGTAAANEVVWSSSNTKVVTVKDGMVTAVAPGKAVIKAISNDGGNKSASLTVTVIQPVTGITLSGPGKVAAGKSITLTAAVSPSNATNKKLDWKVDGNDKVTINASGKVTAKKDATGTCKVTAAAKDGSNKASAAYTVTIVSGEITSIKLSATKLTLFSPKTGKLSTAKLTADIKGKEGMDKTLITWTSSAPSIASVDAKGNVTAKGAGKATITCAATDGSNKKATCTVSVTIPMSALFIGTTDSYGGYSSGSYTGCIASGKSIKMSAKYTSNYGTPTNKKVTWKSSNENVLTVDKNGKVTAKKGASGSASITATAADGSGVTSNKYTFSVTPLFKKLTIEDGFVAVGWDGTGINAKGYTPTYYTVSVSGGKNPGLKKAYDSSSKAYYFYPVPGKVTTSKSSSSRILYTSDLQKMTVTVKLQDGSGLSAKRSIYVARFKDGTIKFFK
ncbi:MAG: S8 family serine peptidase [Lachnospiraceae bacterium]|nr:S8 family serine peptidase [Lachnospiraceae bacterium]